MHSRHTFFINAALCVFAILLSMRLIADWKGANVRYASFPASKKQTLTTSATGLLQTSLPPTTEIVAKNLFSVDRNNDVSLEQKKGPAPPVPVVFGTMNLGGKYEALMTEGGTNVRPSVHRVKDGEEVGGYKVVDITDEKVIVDFQGEKTTINVYQSANSVPPLEARPASAAGPTVLNTATASPDLPIQPAQPATPSTAEPTSTPQPAPTGPPNDPYLKVTVDGNRKRYERQTPFGPAVWYEDIPKQ
jgi:hypothetical protein